MEKRYNKLDQKLDNLMIKTRWHRNKIVLFLFFLTILFTVFYFFIKDFNLTFLNINKNIDIKEQKTEDKRSEFTDLSLSQKAFYSEKYNLKMYPPNGWVTKRDEYFNAEIMFMDKPQEFVSDFASPNAIITLVPFSKKALKIETSDDLINVFKKEIEDTIELINSVEVELGEKSKSRDYILNKYSRLIKSIDSKYKITIDGVDATVYDYASYFNSTDYGMSIIISKGDYVYYIVAEVVDKKNWDMYKDLIFRSMVSLDFLD